MSLEFIYLAERPEALLTVASWYFDEWGHFHPGRTIDDTRERLKGTLNIDQIPFILLGLKDEKVVGAAELKYREMADIFPEKEHWLGGVYVAAEHRGNGIGLRLAEEITTRAPEYGVDKLYLQTERLDGGLYSRLGWQPEQEVDNHGIQVLVMVRDVAA
jgi:GNAT superfamily N-acetyltransferase